MQISDAYGFTFGERMIRRHGTGCVQAVQFFCIDAGIVRRHVRKTKIETPERGVLDDHGRGPSHQRDTGIDMVVEIARDQSGEETRRRPSEGGDADRAELRFLDVAQCSADLLETDELLLNLAIKLLRLRVSADRIAATGEQGQADAVFEVPNQPADSRLCQSQQGGTAGNRAGQDYGSECLNLAETRVLLHDEGGRLRV